MRVPLTLDLHVPNFSFPDVGADRAFETLAAIATTAESAGFSSLSLMDHLHQIALQGSAENWMFEGPTMLSALAARTHRLSFGLLVGSITYRNPVLAAKITTTLDLISGGRAWHGMGAGWFEAEHDAYGYTFPPIKTRLEMLEEAVQIARAMFTSDPVSFDGHYFHASGALNRPRPLRGDIPILVGGSGERKTLRLVAKYADGCNLFGDPARVRHLLGVLERHCEAVGRNPAEITKTGLGRVVIAPTHEAAQAKLDQLRRQGASKGQLDSLIAGDPDTVGERVLALKEAGLEGLCISMPFVYELESLALAGQTLGPVFADVKTQTPA